jgi:hypothetical protein
MKRDFDLVRAILIQLENEEEVSLSEYSEEQIKYHQALVVEAKLADGNAHYASTHHSEIPAGVILKRLTWEGHDFLDNARNKTIWNSAKQIIKDKGATLTVEALKIAMTQAATKLLTS